MEARRSETVGSRLDFAALCNDRCYKIAVEVGTDRGIFARDFLDRWHGEMLYCVDDFDVYPEMPWLREPDMLMAIHLLAPHARRCRLMQMTSRDAAHWMLRQHIYPEFIYIDAAHDLDHVLEDIELWWPLVRPGGVLAGDDFDEEHAGVRMAVLAQTSRWNVIPQLTTDYNRGPSWFIEKPKP